MAEKKELRKIGVLSYAKISAVLSAIMGLVFGVLEAISGAVISSSGTAPQEALGLFGVLSYAVIIVMPIAYAIIGFIFGIVGAFIYNLVAKGIGGIEMHFE